MRRHSKLWASIGVAVVTSAVFVTLTIVVTSSPWPGVDVSAFDIADDLRTPWLDQAARAVTVLGLLAIVGPGVLLGAAFLIRRGHRGRPFALVLGAALAWGAVWITKWAVDRSRPPAPLVHTAGQSYPSAHATNSVGWLALAIAVTAVIPARGGRIAAVVCGALLTVLVGLSRVYLRAHYASDVLAGIALAGLMYALAAIGAIAWKERGASKRTMTASPPSRIP